MEYSIEIDDNNDFYLYIDGILTQQGAKPYIGDHLEYIAIREKVDISNCFAESHMLSVLLANGLSVDVGDW